MSSLSSRVAPLCLALLLTLAGCAHQRPHVSANGDPAAVEVDVNAPSATITSTSFGEPANVPAVLPRGPQAVADTDGPYLLDSGDRLRIFVYGQPNLSRIYTVDHAGTISVPLIGSVKARGLTTQALERSIKGRLGTQFVKDPQVNVDINQHRPFFILGEVKNAGQYPYVNGMTVQSAVAIAGGFSERASERKVQLTRRINGFVEKMDVPSDYVVMPGDTVYVFERFF